VSRRHPRGTSKSRMLARPRAMTSLTIPVARSHSPATSANRQAGQPGPRGPVSIPERLAFRKNQAGRTVGPIVAIRTDSGCARNEPTSSDLRSARRCPDCGSAGRVRGGGPWPIMGRRTGRPALTCCAPTCGCPMSPDPGEHAEPGSRWGSWGNREVRHTSSG